jgi:hypothetical protein
MDDDNKNNHPQNDSESGEEKLAKIIPFDPDTPIGETSNSTNDSDVSLDDLIGTLKSAFGDLKKELEPLKDSFMELMQAMRTELTEVTDEVKAATEETLKAKLNASESPNAPSQDAQTTNDIVSLGLNVFQKEADKTGEDLHTIVSREFAQFADQKLAEDEYQTDENGKRHVVINQAFLKRHSDDVIPSLIRGTLDRIVDVLIGDPKLDEAIATLLGEPVVVANAEKPADVQPQHDYEVQFDLADNWAEAMRNLKVPHIPGTPNDDPQAPARTARIRGLFTEGGQILEDALNGKKIGDTGERLRVAAERAERSAQPADALTEEQIRVIELSKQYEKSMNPDEPDEK